ncbi:MAG: DUF2813 domain-containing protein [Planctomycetaceae bacterium]|jgi:putative ATP-dependent endonuclease of OLD family|nr:DUF2813 domain-containing protein [Planctomycetaceae bacterium]
MKLYKIEIRNFRGIKSLDLTIGNTTVLIGENNTCKTSILEALRFALSVVRSQRGCSFEPFDFYLPETSSDPSTSEPISIRLTFNIDNEKLKGEFTRAKIAQVNESKIQVIFKVGASYNRDSQEFVQNWEFQNINGQAISGLRDTILTEFHNTISYFYLGALRDAAKQFDAKGTFWRPFLKSAQINPETQQKIEQQLDEINSLIINSHESLNKVVNVLKDIDSIVPTKNKNTDWVSVEAVPGRIFDILAKAQVKLNAETGAKIPLTRHGEGTQSLAVLMLFKAYLQVQKDLPFIIALEEPEAHLHPSAIRSLWKIIETLPGQKIISTHSGEILSEVPFDSIARLNKNQGTITVHKLKDAQIDPDDLRKFNYKIKNDRGSLLFARCWILGEGQTEATIIPAAAKILGYDFEQLGIRVVGSQEGCPISPLLSAANTLGIQWVVLADHDDQGLANIKNAKQFLNGRNEAETLFTAKPEKTIESYLCNNGFLSIYEKLKSDQKWEKIKVDKSDPAYPQRIAEALPDKKKTQAAMEVVKIMDEENIIPSLIKDVIEAAVKAAQEI